MVNLKSLVSMVTKQFIFFFYYFFFFFAIDEVVNLERVTMFENLTR